jgi:hypothetical protein
MAKLKDLILNEDLPNTGVTSYNDLTDKPTIPTTLASLTGDSTHRTITDAQLAVLETISNKADISLTVALAIAL